ncbi:hypothetical protein E2C01_071932 [Portunus trituberculatus]|uniref:Uncharacterized protein n=1 Tax=Portunus trituberculatus TaxID=210409 RepID=A0A5B7I9B4_PORTR|nr:hypothetical protein [Portunus trituberculatus]
MYSNNESSSSSSSSSSHNRSSGEEGCFQFLHDSRLCANLLSYSACTCQSLVSLQHDTKAKLWLCYESTTLGCRVASLEPRQKWRQGGTAVGGGWRLEISGRQVASLLEITKDIGT